MRQPNSFITELCTILEKNKAIPRSDGERLKKLYKDRSDVQFEEFLLEEGFVDREDLLQALSIYYKIPSMDVIGIFFDHQLVRMFPKDIMMRKGFIPFQRDGDILMIVASNPDDDILSGIIAQFVSYESTFLVGIRQDILEAIEEFSDPSIVGDIPMDSDHNEEEREDLALHTLIDEERP